MAKGNRLFYHFEKLSFSEGNQKFQGFLDPTIVLDTLHMEADYVDSKLQKIYPKIVH